MATKNDKRARVIERLVADRDALLAQRDELLAACRNLLELAATVQDHALADVIRNEARAAIARAEGK